jgi:adenine-specific DNA-methyltransferase
MPIHSFDKDISLAEELAKNFSYEALEDFLFRKNFTIKPEKKFYLGDKPIDEYGIKKLQLFATKEIKQEPLHVYTLELATNLTDRSSKKRQFDIAKKLLLHDKINIGLFVFHDNLGNFRFSLVYKETFGTKADYSYYKRYTFYVSPNLSNKTFIFQVGKCDFETFESIKSAFSVEPVTKQFYEELQTWYYYAMDKVWFPEDYKYSDNPEKDREIRTALNLIRLITRLIFIWFLKEKELIPEILFDKKQLKGIVKDFGSGHNYYNAILQNLFFATLNRPINERGWAFDKGFPANKSNFGVKSLYRYEDKFLIPPDEVIKIFSEIPFINGGLFDCLDRDSVYIDGFSRNPKKQAKIPDDLFFQEEEQTVDLSKYGLGRKKFRGLIEILKSYNFTTDEATPIDQEIALDPELLGKVFENLLASYNPETATTARKATGSYYTPREIVDYMVDESLKAYFKTVLPDIPEESIELLLSYSDEVPNLTEEHRLKIAKAIDNLKIIDPACGSGAFPMGALHKLVHILQKIDPDNRIWYNIQLEKASKEADEIFRTEKDIEKRNELLRELNENFDTNINESDYARKLYLIENCIYGIDIQPIAIQISKLRFFISLILDQKVDKSKPNSGILPLPNLETKFIAANTLIGLEKPSNTLHLIYQHTATLERDLKLLRHRYFRIKTRREKEDLQKKDKELRKQIANILKTHGWSVEVAEKIASFDPFDQNASADWFDPEWMFGVRDGFDIVTGNPPYVKDELIKPIKPILQKQKYEVYTSGADLFVYFYEKGYQFLKEQGILAYITSNKWMRSAYGKKLRKFLKENTTILKLIDFTGYRVFEQTVDTCILLFKKEKPPKGHIFEFLTVPSDVKDLESYLRKRSKYLIEQETETVLKRVESWGDVETWQDFRDWQTAYVGNWQTMLQEKLSNNGWTLGDDKVLSLKEKIEKVGKPLKDWDVKIYRGITTGCNDVFIIDTETRNRILANCKDEDERKRTEQIIKPVLKGENIEKYRYKWAGKWIIYIPWHFPLHNDKSISGASLEAEQEFEKKYPALYSYLLQFKDRLLKRNKEETGIKYEWYALQRWASNYYSEFEKEKIIYGQFRKGEFAYDKEKMYLSSNEYMITGKNLKYILGVLNSSLAYYYQIMVSNSLSNQTTIAQKSIFTTLPLPPITKENQPIAEQIIQKVDQILTLTQSPDFESSKEKQQKVKELEREIDLLVYKLYGLNEEKIKIIEGGYNG